MKLKTVNEEHNYLFTLNSIKRKLLLIHYSDCIIKSHFTGKKHNVCYFVRAALFLFRKILKRFFSAKGPGDFSVLTTVTKG